MGPGYVEVEMENYTSLPSYLHGLDQGNEFLDSLYTDTPGVPILTRSRQVYRFVTYIAPPPPVPVAAVSQVGTVHTVVAGDSLSLLAEKYYGDMSLWPVIYNANKGTIGPDFNLLAIGQALTIPDRAKLTDAEIQAARALSRQTLHTNPVPVAPLR
ncbi:LysM peptidoglycan-binding domain-containing protein [Piscinibacter sp. HJYY11]|nr:LysM peptidoglycan-binding domain-containing protein [Piscinibacter sp. HJYY11]